MAISKVKPLAAAALILLSGVARAGATFSIFGDATPQTAVVPHTRPVTLGVRLQSAQPGKILGIRFFRGASSRDGYAVELFAANGSAKNVERHLLRSVLGTG